MFGRYMAPLFWNDSVSNVYFGAVRVAQGRLRCFFDYISAKSHSSVSKKMSQLSRIKVPGCESLRPADRLLDWGTACGAHNEGD
ncbi:hypothetical protein BDV37DRAFT_144868 [Aspergillus pseudonomiae]|uniref:Uncharacterized protein n=1 Tax=Aspergillus pseudonomiae TaxID=1506151 RepID=A0A5N7DAC1_9EURO|nr:uncharacterized protein BDV37DRAFT_144868 [Aspergillus pseudonomiae]KAE8403402.1 hypothetical protein BDV37DRAFT_144868 [Aspergillus pseudonomiae]